MTLIFKQAGHETDLVLRHEEFFDDTACNGHKRGWTGSLEKLAAFLRSST